MKNVVALFLFATAILLITWLRFRSKITSKAYPALFVVVCVLGLSFYLSDRLMEVNLREMKLVLSQVESAKRDVYARAEMVKKMAEQVAEVTALNVSLEGPHAMNYEGLSEGQMLEQRDKLLAMLHVVGSDEATIQKTAARIDTMVFFNLRQRLYWVIIGNIGERQKSAVILSAGRRFLLENYDRVAMEAVLKEQGELKPELKPQFDRIDRFQKEKKL
jgi:hypothetical protein